MAALYWINQPRKIVIDAALPVGFAAHGFSHESFATLLQRHVSAEGRVNYDRWHQSAESVQQLRSYLAAVSDFSPNSHPERFSNRNDELAYWLYAYNAYVIYSVLAHWPIESVTDVQAPLEAIKGLGFFHQQRFSFGGDFMSLLQVQNREIRGKHQDPRVHFYLNCASESCPVARPTLSTGDEFEQLLTQAAIDFINDTRNVVIDHDDKTVLLSMIFKWYEDDFVNRVRLDGDLVSNGLMAYIARYASEGLANDMARAGQYTIQFRDYDWDINSTPQAD